MSGKNQITGGAFQDCEGNVLANGYLNLQLSHDSQESIDPGQVIGGFSIRVPLDANGNVLGSVFVWPNDQLNPSNSFYTATAYRADGTTAWLYPQFVSILSTPSPYNIGAWVPTNPPGSVGAPVGSILLQTNGANNTSQSKLNLYSSDSSVTLTADSAGDVNFQTGTGFLSKVVVNITSAQILAMNATPITIVASPGSGKYLNPISSTWEYIFGTMPYSVGGSSLFLVNSAADDGLTEWMQFVCAGFLDQTSSTLAPNFSSGTAIPLSHAENQPLVLSLDGSVSDGDGTMRVTLYYTTESA